MFKTIAKSPGHVAFDPKDHPIAVGKFPGRRVIIRSAGGHGRWDTQPGAPLSSGFDSHASYRPYRVVPLPPGVKLEDVKATFSEGVLEVSLPLPAVPDAKVRQVQIEDATKAARSAA